VPPERRKAKGTVRKAGLAGIVAFIAVVFFAFAREYMAEYRAQQAASPLGELAKGRLDRRPEQHEGNRGGVTSVTHVEMRSAPRDAKPVELSGKA
jgi:hypothetical protein